MKHIVIGIVGFDHEIVGRLAAWLPHVKVRSLAAPARAMLREGLDLSNEEMHSRYGISIPRYGKSPREMVGALRLEQTGSSIWLDALEDSNLILTDMRFRNEAEWVRERGTLIHVPLQEEGVIIKPAFGDVIFPDEESLEPPDEWARKFTLRYQPEAGWPSGSPQSAPA